MSSLATPRVAIASRNGPQESSLLAHDKAFSFGKAKILDTFGIALEACAVRFVGG
jgi:hypothetical protein